ncbi:MAG: hypothetical protein ACODAJ_14475, partial [Planctomycetota bacterium]
MGPRRPQPDPLQPGPHAHPPGLRCLLRHPHLQAVRAGKWKLHLPRPADPPWTPRWARHIKPRDVIAIESPMLFDLDADVGEQRDVAAQHPDVVARLLKLAEQARQDIGDYD